MQQQRPSAAKKRCLQILPHVWVLGWEQPSPPVETRWIGKWSFTLKGHLPSICCPVFCGVEAGNGHAAPTDRREAVLPSSPRCPWAPGLRASRGEVSDPLPGCLARTASGLTPASSSWGFRVFLEGSLGRERPSPAFPMQQLADSRDPSCQGLRVRQTRVQIPG